MNPKSSNSDLFTVKWIDDPQSGTTDQPMRDPQFVMALGINFPELRPSLCLSFLLNPNPVLGTAVCCPDLQYHGPTAHMRGICCGRGFHALLRRNRPAELGLRLDRHKTLRHNDLFRSLPNLQHAG